MKLTFSPEQMAEMPQKPPALPFSGRRSTASFWVTILAIILPGAFLRWATTPRLAILPWWLELFHIPIILVGGLFGTIFFHELGHIFLGRLLGFKIVYLIVGPLKLVRTLKGWRLLSSGLPGFAIQGRVLAVPPPWLWSDTDELRRRLLWFYSGGPAATFFQAAVLGALLFLAPDRTFHHVGRSSLIALFLLTTMVLGWVVYPLTVNEIPNDMTQILRLRHRTPETRRLMALLILQGQLVDGRRPRHLDEAVLAQALMIQDGSADEIAARLLAIARADDEGRIDEVEERLSDLLREMHRLPPRRRSAPILWQAALFDVQHGGDVAAARRWMDHAAAANQSAVVESWLMRFIAELGLAVNRSQPEAAANLAGQVGLLLDYTHSPGAAMPVAEWLQALNMPAPRNPPRRPWHFIWRPVVFSIMLTSLVVVAVTFFIVILIIS